MELIDKIPFSVCVLVLVCVCSQFFNSTSYVIGGLVFSLNDIENGVLRANRRAVGAWGRPFGRTDPR